METIEYTTIDKSDWRRGPWDNEPDKVQWPDPETGLPCLAVRHSRMGHWCGYVGIDESHPWHKVDYSDETPLGNPVDRIDVHGGITFADACRPHEAESEGVCHVPGNGEPDHVWWFGFDCAHLGDESPGYELISFEDNWYKDLNFVRRHCASMAKQLASLRDTAL